MGWWLELKETSNRLLEVTDVFPSHFHRVQFLAGPWYGYTATPLLTAGVEPKHSRMCCGRKSVTVPSVSGFEGGVALASMTSFPTMYGGAVVVLLAYGTFFILWCARRWIQGSPRGGNFGR